METIKVCKAIAEAVSIALVFLALLAVVVWAAWDTVHHDLIKTCL